MSLWRATGLFWLGLLLPCVLLAADTAKFSVENVHVTKESGVYMLQADLDLRLADEMIAALGNGVELVFLVEIELVRHRRWLPDDTVGKLEQRFELAYHSLTERYVVRNVNTDYRDAYPSLSAALRGLSRIENLPVIDTDLVDPKRMVGQIRVQLDLSHLPIPVRINAYTDKVWRTSSDWSKWSLY